jgi:hypothetical protein
VQRVAAHGAPRLGIGGGADRGEGVADVVREVERDEQPQRFRGANVNLIV